MRRPWVYSQPRVLQLQRFLVLLPAVVDVALAHDPGIFGDLIKPDKDVLDAKPEPSPASIMHGIMGQAVDPGKRPTVGPRKKAKLKTKAGKTTKASKAKKAKGKLKTKAGKTTKASKAKKAKGKAVLSPKEALKREVEKAKKMRDTEGGQRSLEHLLAQLKSRKANVKSKLHLMLVTAHEGRLFEEIATVVGGELDKARAAVLKEEEKKDMDKMKIKKAKKNLAKAKTAPKAIPSMEKEKKNDKAEIAAMKKAIKKLKCKMGKLTNHKDFTKIKMKTLRKKAFDADKTVQNLKCSAAYLPPKIPFKPPKDIKPRGCNLYLEKLQKKYLKLVKVAEGIEVDIDKANDRQPETLELRKNQVKKLVAGNVKKSDDLLLLTKMEKHLQDLETEIEAADNAPAPTQQTKPTKKPKANAVPAKKDKGAAKTQQSPTKQPGSTKDEEDESQTTDEYED
eukprot:TRINITY_DN2344_c0_g1_i1.p1 TRINITY_DN2344_c0_g1~~TRINITY_DN2344_c0_g1_i1.p1  ORF type:complete len:451 (-),score=116.71 TRINITY_DN2344_c0_g1_i1:148-1500(-)